MAKEPKSLSQRAARREERVLAACEAVFARQGIERTTVDDVVAEGGMARATFYRAFPSLDAAIEALYDRYERDVLTRLERDLSSAEAQGSLAGIVDGVLQEHALHGDRIRAMYREELRPGRGLHAMRRRVQLQVQRVAHWWWRTQNLPADDDLITCLVLLLQSAAIYANGLPEPERNRLRDALVRVFEASAAAHIARVSAN